MQVRAMLENVGHPLEGQWERSAPAVGVKETEDVDADCWIDSLSGLVKVCL
jgi:hypothetical protein